MSPPPRKAMVEEGYAKARLRKEHANAKKATGANLWAHMSGRNKDVSVDVQSRRVRDSVSRRLTIAPSRQGKGASARPAKTAEKRGQENAPANTGNVTDAATARFVGLLQEMVSDMQANVEELHAEAEARQPDVRAPLEEIVNTEAEIRWLSRELGAHPGAAPTWLSITNPSAKADSSSRSTRHKAAWSPPGVVD